MGVLPTGDAVRKEMLLVVDRRLIEYAVEEVGEEVGEAGVEEFVCVGTRILKGTIPTAMISTVSDNDTIAPN